MLPSAPKRSETLGSTWEARQTAGELPSSEDTSFETAEATRRDAGVDPRARRASSTAASTVADQVRKPLAESSSPATSLR